MKKSILRGIRNGALSFAIIIGIRYISAFIRNKSFDPDWIWNIVFAVIVCILSIFGPDAAQRKKNREDLAKKFKK